MSDRPSIYNPVYPFHVNQHFGDNLPCVKDYGLPTQDIVTGADANTCPVGYDKLYKHFGMLGHNGTDLQAGEQNVYAAYDGVVVEKQTVPARGLGLGILTDAQYDFGAQGTHFFKLRYWHLKSFYCEVGDKITAGQLIGVSNNTGYSSGNHLHFEMQLMDKDSGGHPYVALPNNGFAGAVSVEPYLNGVFAGSISTVVPLYQKAIVILQGIINALKARSAVQPH
jgi:murein DD-endopeptidase MepM/ murein hydrolase activator NlpD